MTDDTYGSPNLNDPSAFTERDIETVAGDITSIITRDGPMVQNRTLGSVPVTAAQQHEDWMRGKDAPDYWAQAHQQYAYLGQRAALELLRYDAQQQKKHAKMEGA